MTAIVGLVDKGTAWLGGDSGSFRGWDRDVHPGGKLFRVGEVMIGLAGSAVDAQTIQYGVKLPEIHGGDLKAWTVQSLVPEVKRALKERARVTTKDGLENWESTFLVAVRDRVFRVGSEFYVGERDDPYYAVGCGADFALGVLYATKGAPKKRLEAALNAAAYFSAGVHPPFTFASTSAKRAAA